MPEEAKLSFTSEEERAKAMDELPETSENIEKLREMREAPIVEKVEGEGGETPPETPPETPAATPETPPETPSGEVDLKGYKNLPELLKAFDEQKGLIERQQGFIREKLQQGPVEDPQTQKAMERAEKAERELEELKNKQAGVGGHQGEEKIQTRTDIASTQQELQKIDDLLKELEEEEERDPDLAFDAGHRKKERELQRLQRKALGELNSLYVQAMDEVKAVKDDAAKVKQSNEEFINTSKRGEENRRREEAKLKTIEEMDSLAKDPELKEFAIGKSYADAEASYVEFRNNVALAYYGRPAKSREEAFVALDQLQMKNPELMNKLQIMGIKPEPAVEVQRYMELCDALDYMEGLRKDPVTGKSYRLTKHDPVTGQNVPLVMPSLKDAVHKMRLDSGYYSQRQDDAYQQGAQAFASAAQRRDVSVKELNDGVNQGQIGNQQSVEWAMKIIEDESIEEEAMKRFRAGDPKAFEEINKAREIIGMEPLAINA